MIRKTTCSAGRDASRQRIDFILEREYFDMFSKGILSPYAVAVYSRLFAIDNDLQWAKWFEVSNTILMASAHIGNERTLCRARNDLVKSGFIIYDAPSKGLKGRYQLVKLYDPVPERFQEIYRQSILPINSPAATADCKNSPSKFWQKCALDPSFVRKLNVLFTNCMHHKANSSETSMLIQMVNTYGPENTMSIIRKFSKST